MPPKKAKATNENPSSKQELPANDVSNAPSPDAPQANGSSTVPSKRKAAAKETPSKNPRRSARTASTAPPTALKLLNYLLSDASLDASRPKDEKEDIKTRGVSLRTYSSSTFSPFEELLGAIILSRPISHALGLRSIRTLFNEPYQLTTPKAIRDAGFEGVRKALDEARTQHRQKTAEEIGILANAVVETFGEGDEDVKMEKLRKECGHNFEKARL